MKTNGKRRIAILGSTGSIGTQALDVISQHPDMFEVELLTANNNSSLLIEQALKFNPSTVVICNPDKYDEVADALQSHFIKVFAGIDSVTDLMSSESIDMVLASMVGFSGLRPTVAAIRAGKAIALANKETLVAAGGIIMPLAQKCGAPILPVDSEHSAIFQCLQGERVRPSKIILTGSGGPFLNTPVENLPEIRKEQALKHPRWNMGAKVTIDSSTLMNKGLEFIEAKWLFDMQPDDIEIVIHPQSIIHSMVRFHDGCTMAQMALPDMRLPIQYALSYPFRAPLNLGHVDFPSLGSLTFFEPDTKRFPCLDIARNAIRTGGSAPCTMNAANEMAVAAFLSDRIKFTDIPAIIADTLSAAQFVKEPSLDDIFRVNEEGRRIAQEIINKK